MRGLRLVLEGSIERAFKRQKLKDKGLLPVNKKEVNEMSYDEYDEYGHLNDDEVLDL